MSKVIPLYLTTNMFQTLERHTQWRMGTFDRDFEHDDILFGHFDPSIGGSLRRRYQVSGITYTNIYLRRFKSTQPFKYDENLGCIVVRPLAKSLQRYTFPLYPFPNYS